MPSPQLGPPPSGQPIANSKGQITSVWQQWFSSFWQRSGAQDGQNGSEIIGGATDALLLGELNAEIGQTIAPLVAGKVPIINLPFGSTANTIADGGQLAATAQAANAAAATANSASSTANAAEAVAAAANTLAAAALPLSAVLSTPITANTFGGGYLDVPGHAYLTTTLAKIAQQIGSEFPAANLANNPNLTPPTTGLFWTVADAIAAGFTASAVNVAALYQAALTFSAASGLFVAIPDGFYDFGTATFLYVGGERLRRGKNAIFSSSRTPNPNATHSTINFKTSGKSSNITIIGGIDTHPGNVWYDFFSSAPWGGVRGSPPTYSNWRCVTGGYQAPGTFVLSWQTSAVQPFVRNSNTIAFDTLPPGCATLAVASSALVGMYLHSNAYLYYGGTVASITQPGGAGTPYIVTCTPPAGSKFITQLSSAGAVPALPRNSATSANPNQIEQIAIAPPSIDFLTTPAVFYNGNDYVLHGDNLTMIDVETRHTVGGRAYALVGNDITRINCRGFCTDGNQGSACIKYAGGDGFLDYGGTYFAGDEGMQLVVASGYSGGAFGASANQNMSNARYVNGRTASLSAQCLTGALTVANYQQAIAWQTGTSPNIPAGNSFTLPAPIPAGLTLAALNQSAPPWGNSTPYPTVGQPATNNGGYYTIATPGTSDPNSNGPGPGNANLSDGTCVWTYVGPGAPVFLGARAKAVLSGTCVASAILSGSVTTGTYTITVTPPTGSVNAIPKPITTSNAFQFQSGGVPLGALTASCTNSGFYNIHCICPSSLGVSSGNTDSTGEMDLTFSDIVFDCTVCPTAAISDGVISLHGGSLGGAKWKFSNVRVFGNLIPAIYTSGFIKRLDIVGSWFDPYRGPYTAPNLFISGALSGVMERCDVWAPPANNSVHLGSGDSVDTLGQAVSNSVYNFEIKSNHFYGITDGQIAVNVANGAKRTCKANVFHQITALGAVGANAGAFATSATANLDVFDGNFFDQTDGPAYTIGGAGICTIGGNDLFNPAPASGYVAPKASSAPAYQKIGQPNSNPVLAAFTQQLCYVECVQTNIPGSCSITLPVGVPGQQIVLMTRNQIPILTIPGSNWTALSSLPAGSSVSFYCSPVDNLWVVMGMTTGALAGLPQPTLVGQIGVVGNQLVTGG